MLEEFIKTLELKAEPVTFDCAPDASLTLEEKFKADCATWPTPMKGGRNNNMFALACKGTRDYNLPKDIVFEHIRDIYNPQLSDPLSDLEIHSVVNNSSTYANNTPGNELPEAVFTPDMAPPAASAEQLEEERRKAILRDFVPKAWDANKQGRLYSTPGNAIYALAYDPLTSNQFIFNEFSKDIECKSRPIWRKNDFSQSTDINERDVAFLIARLSTEFRLDIPENKLINAIHALAVPTHPVKDYLNKCHKEWDGVARLDRILVDTAGADDRPYVRQFGSKTLIGAVMRIFEPGCKHKSVLVLEGKQDLAKSMWVDELGGEWYATVELNRGDKDTYQNQRGKWIMELPEVNATFSKWDVNWLKGMISSRVDVYRPSYARKAQSFPRQSIFIATINPNATGEYLKDDENCRYWTVKTPRFDIELLKRYRNQYFGEAMHRYKAGETNWIDDAEIKKEVQKQQEMRREKDPWDEIVAGWVGAQTEGFTPAQVYGLLESQVGRITSYHRSRLYGALHRLGYEFSVEFGTGGKWIKKNLSWGDLL